MNKKYKAILFDLDGTLIDTSDGIINCYKHVMDIMNLKRIPGDTLRTFIGSNLFNAFKNNFNIDDNEARLAVQKYRKHYAEKGLYESKLYPGIDETLYSLKQNQYLIGIATLKLETLAQKIIDHFKLNSFFNCISGIDESDSLTKENIINNCLNNLSVENSNDVLMVGDTVGDAVAAAKCGVDFMAVTYGFGLKTRDELNFIKYSYLAADVSNIKQVLCPVTT